MTRTTLDGATADDLWQALDGLPMAPSLQDSDADRQCWWRHLYAILERHGLGIRESAAWR
ncbi:MAG TPA: hypothetical protein VFG49_03340 [Dyella sp.]|uniref:hypothetical protein n=1 Tax=Dyella sp. TaxID=1869338 RepID=UPI002D792E23|nr:hypothetical protein [Dyella sp.]HET6552547.1 hypothetical protein [Dyella sp.]